MKAAFLRYIVGPAILLGSFSLRAANSNNNPAAQETWDTISNRWGSVEFEKVLKSAEQGDVSAQYYAAIAYRDGNGAPTNSTEAFKWMKLAADQGMPRAERNLGRMFENGLGVATSLDDAVVWYQKASAHGDAQAQFNLGWMYDNGRGVPSDMAQAAKLYRLAADQGVAMAQNNLGWMYKQGIAVPQDPTEALKWFQKSAAQGEPYGEENLAWMYAQGEYGPGLVHGQGAEEQVRSGGIAPNHQLAEEWMRKAVDLNTAEGQYKLGNLIYREMNNEGTQDTNFFAAAEWLQKSAEQGYVSAQFLLAEMYNTGKLGDDQRSNCIPWYLKAAAQGNAEAKAEVGQLNVFYPKSELLKSVDNIKALQESAEQGNLRAQYQLAKRCQTGIGVTKDPAEAFKWMRMASQNNTASSLIGNATYELGLMYEKGEGTPQDINAAYKCFIAAAGPEFAEPDALFRVGQMYEKGEGVPQDDQKAVDYYSGKCITYRDGYPNGFISYCGFSKQGSESVLRLMVQGRGLPTEEEKAMPGYQSPLNLAKQWENSMATPEPHYYLGLIYYHGILTSPDLVEACARFHLAANHNLAIASKSAAEVELKMSSEQLTTAKVRLKTLEQNFEQAVILVKDLDAAKRAQESTIPW
jgi:TPR repeat protein